MRNFPENTTVLNHISLQSNLNFKLRLEVSLVAIMTNDADQGIK